MNVRDLIFDWRYVSTVIPKLHFPENEILNQEILSHIFNVISIGFSFEYMKHRKKRFHSTFSIYFLT